MSEGKKGEKPTDETRKDGTDSSDTEIDEEIHKASSPTDHSSVASDKGESSGLRRDTDVISRVTRSKSLVCCGGSDSAQSSPRKQSTGAKKKGPFKRMKEAIGLKETTVDDAKLNSPKKLVKLAGKEQKRRDLTTLRGMADARREEIGYDQPQPVQPDPSTSASDQTRNVSTDPESPSIPSTCTNDRTFNESTKTQHTSAGDETCHSTDEEGRISALSSADVTGNITEVSDKRWSAASDKRWSATSETMDTTTDDKVDLERLVESEPMAATATVEVHQSPPPTDDSTAVSAESKTSSPKDEKMETDNESEKPI